jgi:hypothetical protein
MDAGVAEGIDRRRDKVGSTLSPFVARDIDASLAPPGAGVPWPELVLGRVLFGSLRMMWSREVALQRFVKTGRRIVGRIRILNDEAGSQRVLVPRLTGLEDSSRHWSPFMIAQHLFIVNRDGLAIIEALGAGRLPAGEVRTAGLKPQPGASRSVVSDLEKIIAAYELLPFTPGWSGPARHRHPWFGPLSAHGWLCLVAMHHTIHERQLRHVLRLSKGEGGRG